MEKEKPSVAVSVFVIREGKILLGKRKGKVGDGFWGLPGGKLELYESLVSCAKRELEEETGLVANKMTFLHVINDTRLKEDRSHWVHFEFLAENFTGEPELKEPEKCYEWKWFEIKKLPENIFIGHRRSIPTLLNKVIVVDDGEAIFP